MTDYILKDRTGGREGLKFNSVTVPDLCMEIGEASPFCSFCALARGARPATFRRRTSPIHESVVTL